MKNGPAHNSSDANSVSGQQYTPLDKDIVFKTACCCCSAGYFCKIPECCMGYGCTNACLNFQCKNSARIVSKCIACCQCQCAHACCNVENGMSSEALHHSNRGVCACCCETVNMCSITMCPTTCQRTICWCCCLDCRLAIPCNDDVPCEVAFCGLYCMESQLRKDGMIGASSAPGAGGPQTMAPGASSMDRGGNGPSRAGGASGF
jgi:hypothetical protein